MSERTTTTSPPSRPGPTDGDARPAIRLTSVTIACPDPGALAGFYERLLGARPSGQEDGWAQIRTPALTVNFERDRAWTPVEWPSRPEGQNATQHLDIHVEDLPAGVAWAESCGAAQDPFQPQEGVRVMRDPAGIPFCLFTG